MDFKVGERIEFRYVAFKSQESWQASHQLSEMAKNRRLLVFIHPEEDEGECYASGRITAIDETDEGLVYTINWQVGSKRIPPQVMMCPCCGSGGFTLSPMQDDPAPIG